MRAGVVLFCVLGVSCSSGTKGNFGTSSQRKLPDVVPVGEMKKAPGNSDEANSVSDQKVVYEPIVAAAVPTRPPNEDSPAKLENSKIVLSSPSSVTIRWQTQRVLPDIQAYVFRVLDNQERVLTEKIIPYSDPKIGDKFEEVLGNFLTPDSIAKVTVSVETSSGRNVAPAVGLVIVDSKAPVARVHLGTVGTLDPCKTPPPRKGSVANRILSVEYCAAEDGVGNSGVSAACLRPDMGDAAPGPKDSCWIPIGSFKPAPLLSRQNNGLNAFELFVRDEAGNVAFSKDSVILAKNSPPTVDILSPTGRQISLVKWSPGQKHTLRWSASDNDTAPESIRSIVTLVNAADSSDFRHLACSGRDNPGEVKQCPDPKLQASTAIKSLGNGESSYEFVVPSNWDQKKQYLLLVTAIDQAGNAAVASTQEINAHHEVLAGRTYNGAGGSGPTFQTKKSVPVADRRGQILLTQGFGNSGGVKFRAVDGRSCRFIRFAGMGPSPFDCEDIVTSPVNLLDRTWTYDSKRDVFYAAEGNVLYRIDANKRSVSPVFGMGTAPVSAATRLVPGVELSGSGSGLSTKSFYDSINDRLYFVSNGRLLFLDSSDKVSFVLGNGAESLAPNSQTNVLQKDIVIPSGVRDFVVTKDNKLVWVAARPSSWPYGGFAIHYVSNRFDPLNPNNAMTLGIADKEGSVISGQQPAEFSMMSAITYGASYDPVGNKVYFGSCWCGIHSLDVPSGVPSDLSWYRLVRIDKGNPNYTYSAHLTSVPFTSVLYFSDEDSGKIIELDRTSGAAEMVVGIDFSALPSQMGQNRFLESPTNLFAVSPTEVYAADFYSLHKLELVSGVWQSSTAVPNFPRGTFKIDPQSGRLVLLGRRAHNHGEFLLSSYRYPEMSLIAERDLGLTQFTRLAAQILSGNLVTGKFLMLAGNEQGARLVQNLVSGSYTTSPSALSLSQVSPNLSPSASIGLATCGANQNSSCAQGTQVQDPRGGNFVPLSEYRFSDVGGNYAWKTLVGVGDFDSTSNMAYLCSQTNKLLAVETNSSKAFEADIVLASGQKVNCDLLGGRILLSGGKIYVATGDKLYSSVQDSVVTQNKLVVEEVKLVTSVFPQSTPNIGGISLVPAGPAGSGQNAGVVFSDFTGYRVLKVDFGAPR